LIYSFNKYLFQAAPTPQKNCVCVCVWKSEKHLMLYTKLSKYNLYYLWSVFCLTVMYTKLTIVTLMWGLKCTDSDLTTLFYITVDKKKDYTTVFLWNVKWFWPVNVCDLKRVCFLSLFQIEKLIINLMMVSFATDRSLGWTWSWILKAFSTN
jgi:hypothetical protein